MSQPTKRNTKQKEAVRLALTTAPGFVSAQQLHQELTARGVGVGLATVYRVLGEFCELGEADSIAGTDGQALFRACTANHHHHLICRVCGKTVEIDAQEVEAWAARMASAQGFKDIGHTIELFGTCQNC